MKILNHDYGGYPFSSELSNLLAERGHQVLHVYCSSLTNTPVGGASVRAASGASFMGVGLSRPLKKYSYMQRWLQENEYGRLLSRVARDYKAEVVLSANAPLDAQRKLFATATQVGSASVYWLQDLIGAATEAELNKKSPVLGRLVGGYYSGLEKRLVAEANRVVAISQSFLPILQRWNLDSGKIDVIHNWAPIKELPLVDRDNAWSSEQNLGQHVRFMYTGNLGAKHDAHVLIDLARELHRNDCGEVIVVSQGQGADLLRQLQLSDASPPNLRILPFQPMERLAEVMGAADVLIGLLTPAAGQYSVPSKVLAYLCAGRPVLLSVPYDNLAAEIVLGQRAGLVAEPGDTRSFIEKALLLAADPSLRHQAGLAGRGYAELHFQPHLIVDRFEQALSEAVRSYRSTRKFSIPPHHL